MARLVSGDCDNRRPGFGVSFEELQRLTRPAGARIDRFGPVVREGKWREQPSQRPLRPGPYGHIASVRQRQSVLGVARANAARVGVRCDSHDLGVCPTEHHRKGAEIVGVGSDVGVKVDALRCAGHDVSRSIS